MAKILTQEEVDALLSAVSTEEEKEKLEIEEKAVKPAKVKEQYADKKVTLYNFRRPDRVSKEQLRSLHYLHDRFSRNFSSSLSAFLRALIEVNLISVEQLTYAEFVLSLPDPTYFNALSMSPLEGNAVLEINPQILFPMIDKILGGKGENFGGGLRTITDIEKTLIEGVVKLILRDLEEVWKQIVPLKMNVVATETSPQLIQIVAPNEVVVLIVMELKVGEAKGVLNFCIPAIVLEPIAHRFSQDWYADRAKTSIEETKKIKLNLLKVPLRVDVDLISNYLTVADILSLEPGDLIQLESKKNDYFTAKLNGIAKFQCFPVKKCKKRSVQILNIIQREFKND